MIRRDGRKRARLVEMATGVLLAVAFAAVFTYPVLQRFGRLTGNNDWDQQLTSHFVSYVTVVRYHQFPLWNPYVCGGTPALADPLSRILTPFFFLHLLFGPEAGLQLEILLHVAIAVAGGYHLGRVLGFSRIASVLTAVVFPGSSWLYLHLAEGHIAWLPYLYLPWLVVLFWPALTKRNLFRAGIAGGVIALQVGEGGIWAAPLSALTAAVLTLVAMFQQRSIRPTRILLCTALVGFALSAPKLLPMWQLMQINPRVIESPERSDAYLLYDAFLSTDQDRYGQKTSALYVEGFHEYGAFVGIAIFALVVVGLLPDRERRHHYGPWLTLAVVALLLGVGRFETSSGRSLWSIWSQAHQLPFLRSMHVPSRSFPLVVFAAGLLAAIGCDALTKRFGARGTLAAAACGLVFLGQAWLTGPSQLNRMYGDVEGDWEPASTFRQAAVSTWDHMYPSARAGLGAIDCYEPGHLPIAAQREGGPDYRGEAYLDGAGTVTLSSWSPNALSYDLDASGESQLTINQNFDSAWTISEGSGVMIARDGVLAVKVPPGRQRLTLTYRSHSFELGCAIAGAAFLFVVALFISSIRDQRARPRQPRHA